jgi:hypothetical protein
VTENARCETCHLEIAREWRSSLHRRAHTDAAYQRAFALEPLPFCQGCHAPEANPEQPVAAAVGEMGVACVTCHVLEGNVVALRNSDSACASCHEFAFPDSSARRVPELMQSTLSEHARSDERERSCADCHMPRARDGHRSHAFPGGYDEQLVQSALEVSAHRTPSGVQLRLTPRRAGHAVPTGDLFRRLEVSAEAVGAEWQVVASDRRYLARHWQRIPGPFGMVLRQATGDDRPLDDAVEVALELGDAARARPITWRVAYQRVEHPRSEREQDSAVEGEIEIASGTASPSP